MNMSTVSEQEPELILDWLRTLQKDASNHPLDLDESIRASDALFNCYLASPEAATVDNPLEGPRMLADLAATQYEVTIAALSGRQLDEILFETIPAVVSVGPDIARELIDTMRAFFVWLGREFALEQANELIQLLGDDAVRELELRLDDRSNYGVMKTMAMDAMAAGIDLSDRDAINAFMMSRLGTDPLDPLSPAFDDPYADHFGEFPSISAPTLTPEQQRNHQKKRKKNRKASRKARKKNR